METVEGREGTISRKEGKLARQEGRVSKNGRTDGRTDIKEGRYNDE